MPNASHDPTRAPVSSFLRPWAAGALLLLATACADDIPAVPHGTETGTTTAATETLSATGTTTSGADTTATESASGSATGSSSSSGGSSSSSGGDTDTTTGGMALPGQTMSQLVSAGTRTGSSSYTLVHTMGQPSALQSTHVSPSYRLQGGLVGANGSRP